jgi:hypothetical protein
MLNMPSMYIRGRPIDTPLGKIYFIKMEEYDEINKYQELLYFDKEDLHDVLKTILNTNKEDILERIKPEYVNVFNNYQAINLIKEIKELGYYNVFKSIIDYFCGENIFDYFVTTDMELLIYKIQIMGVLNNNLLDNTDDDVFGNFDDLSIQEKKDVEKQLGNKIVKDFEKDNFFINIIKNIQELNLYNSYNSLFNLCFKDDIGIFDKIQKDKDLFYYLHLIAEMNCIFEPKDIINDENADEDVKRFNKYDELYLSEKPSS